MKKIIALVLAIVCIASSLVMFSACGSSKKLVCGVTIIPGLNEKDANGNWTGFESEFAMAVGEKLGMEVEFQEISWEQKYNELNSGAITCIWNGFTANSSDNGQKRSELVDFSYGYMLNQQCIVVKSDKAASFTSTDSLKDKKCAVEGGSAGDTFAQTVTSDIVKATVQMDAFTEVKSGAVEFAVVDIVLAQNVCGKGNYTDLQIVDDIKLDSEIYAIGFKKGSKLTEKVNKAIKELEADGTLATLAKKYGFENVVKVMETIE